jgi:hypothetical protein
LYSQSLDDELIVALAPGVRGLMSYEYEVKTSDGDYRLRTNRHHSKATSVHQWIQEHTDQIAKALGASPVTLLIHNIFHRGRQIY